MKKLTIDGLQIDYYYEKMENGLEVYIVPTNRKKTYATFTTKYGAADISFKPLKSKKFIKTPPGIAHFLEHKLFENEKIHPFKFYNNTNSYCNAHTTANRTTYLFEGPFNFQKNINFLLDFVQNLYLTDENVLKEKGIIKQEIKMRDNHPYGCLMDNLYRNLCINDGVREPIGGSEDDVEMITKQDLELCYQTFYHPENMFLVITGKVKPELALDIIRKNQAKKHFLKMTKINFEKKEEPDNVKQEETILYRNVGTSKVAINFKINISHLKIKRPKISNYIYIYNLAKFGWDSKLNADLIEKNLIEEGLGFNNYLIAKHTLLTIFTESDHEQEVIKIIKQKIKKFDISEELFNRKKKLLKSSYLYMPDQVVSLNEWFVGRIIAEGRYENNIIKQIDDLNYEEFKETIMSFNFNHNNYVIVKKDLQKK